MQVTGRVIDEDGTPWELSMVIDNATYHSPDLALIALRVLQVDVDASRRADQRVPIGGVAWLVAVSCRDVVDGDRVEGSLEDLSKSGVAFATRRVLRIHDRLMFHGRFFADEINGEVRVASLRPAQAPGQMIVGCRFLDLDAESAARIDRILSRRQGEPARAGDDARPGIAAAGRAGLGRGAARGRPRQLEVALPAQLTRAAMRPAGTACPACRRCRARSSA